MASPQETEIHQLHDFFERWLRGEADEGALARAEEVFDEEMTFIGPDGRVLEREALLEGLARARGARPELRITVEEVRVEALGQDRWVVTYVERQREPGQATARRSTALLVAAEGAPQGVRWRHVHETWIEPSGAEQQ